MPISKKRKKKKGRKLGKGTSFKIDPNKESTLTIQDLINVVAYQEAKKGNYVPPQPVEEQAAVGEIYAKVWTHEDTEIAPNIIVRADAVVNIPGPVPVNIENTRGEKIGIGTAYPIEGDPGHVSIEITDPEILKSISAGPFSVDPSKEENEDGRI